MTRASRKLAPVPSFPELNGADELLDMLTFRRPAWSKTEAQFIDRFIRPLGVIEDAYGNLYKRIGDAPILWSSHTDTVHTQGGRQRLRVSNGVITQSDRNSNCLGADCTAGVWLMLEMARAKRPGLYIFHRAEEIGGKGSAHIAAHGSALLAGIEYAVAFDRRANNSIITHQYAGRCCSGAFATSLSSALGMAHSADSGGSFTDTANYTNLIGECSNLSVGYEHEHTKRESLDFNYLQELRDALLRLDPSDLVSERKPGDVDPDYYDTYADFDELWPDEDQTPEGVLGPHYSSCGSLQSLVRNHPDEVADWLEGWGVNADELEMAIFLRGGIVRKR